MKKIYKNFAENLSDTEKENTILALYGYMQTILKDEGLDIRTPGRKREKADMVKIFSYYANKTLGYSASRISWYLNRTHATITHAIERYEFIYFSNNDFRDKADHYKTRFKNIDGFENNEPNRDKLHKLCDRFTEEKCKKILMLLDNIDGIIRLERNLSQIEVKSEMVAYE